MEKGSSRLTSAVKPLMELLPSEAVIDIKPETDDDFGEDPAEAAGAQRGARGSAGRPSVELYRAGQSKLSNAARAAEAPPSSSSSYGRHQESRSGRTSRGGSGKVLIPEGLTDGLPQRRRRSINATPPIKCQHVICVCQAPSCIWQADVDE